MMAFMQDARGMAARMIICHCSRGRRTGVRMLVRQAMAGRGREVVVSGGHVHDAQGTLSGLRNIAAICRNDPRGEEAWPPPPAPAPARSARVRGGQSRNSRVIVSVNHFS
jgi:hypothetical protein